MKYLITAYPYATTVGTIEVPAEEPAFPYITEHFNEIKFEKPELEYAGTDFEYEPIDDEESEGLSEEDLNKLCRRFVNTCFTLWSQDADITPERLKEEVSGYINNIQSHIDAGNGDGMISQQKEYKDLLAFVSDTNNWDRL